MIFELASRQDSGALKEPILNIQLIFLEAKTGSLLLFKIQKYPQNHSDIIIPSISLNRLTSMIFRSLNIYKLLAIIGPFDSRHRGQFRSSHGRINMHVDYRNQPPKPQIVLPCLLRAQTTSIAVTVFLLACSVQVTASRTIPSRNPLRTCLESSQMKDEILLTPPLRANLLMAGLVMPSIEALACLLWAVLLVPTLPFPPTPLPPFPCPAIVLKNMNVICLVFGSNIQSGQSCFRALQILIGPKQNKWIIIRSNFFSVNPHFLKALRLFRPETPAIFLNSRMGIRPYDFYQLSQFILALGFQQIQPSMQRKFVIFMVLLLITAVFIEARTRGKESKPKNGSKKKQKNIEQEYVPHYLTPDKPQFWFNCLLATFLALAGGFCSGMTVGLNSLSILNLQIMQKSQDKQTKAMADRILGVIGDHHLFLTTLLVGNAIVLESLPLVIHLLMPDWAAILFSTVVVLVVAEVVPMSWSTGSHKYIIAYYGCPLVSVMIKVFWPLCYPMARGLDRLLGGEHQERILRRDFLTFINDKRKNQLDELEIDFINRVMNHTNKTIKDIMIPFQSLFMLEEHQPITESVANEISHLEYSFIIIYRKEKQNIIGYVKTKEVILKYLMLGNHSKPVAIHELIKHSISDSIVRIYNDAIATEALEILEANQTRVTLVTDQQKHEEKTARESDMSVISVYSAKEWVVKEPSKIIGLVTLNQILYEIADYPTEALKVSQRKLTQVSLQLREI